MSSTNHNPSSRATRLEKAITNPGTVKINVKGAFIVDEDPRSKSPVRLDGVHYEGHDIRLPHHTGVVSHVAVDVSDPASFFFNAPSFFLAVPRIVFNPPPAIDLQFRSHHQIVTSATDFGCLVFLDRWFSCEINLFYTRAGLRGQWRPIELY